MGLVMKENTRFCVLAISIVNILTEILLVEALQPSFSKHVLDSQKKKLFAPSSYPAGSVYNNTCMTKGCLVATLEILKNIDKKVDPCDDFYEFACGNFIRKTDIPNDKAFVSQFTALDDLLMDQLKSIFDEPILADDIKPFRQAKGLYNSCMNHEKIEVIGLTPIKNLLKKLGGWPVLENNWNEESFSWQEMIYQLRREGNNFEILVELSVTTDVKNSSIRTVEIDEPDFSINREHLVEGFSDEILDAYYKYMVDIAVIFGADRIRAIEELKKSLQFEKDLANITLPREEKRDASKLYHPMTVAEAQRRFPVIPWLKYINTLLAPSNKITEEEIIVFTTPKYLTDLEALLKVTPKRVVANYIAWRIVASSIFFLTKEVKDRQLQFNNVLTGTKTHEPRWKECLNLAMGIYNIAMGSLYVRRYFEKESRNKALEMIERIRREMYRTLSAVDWMDENTKKIALDKAHSMINHIGYPDELLDNNKLSKFYEKLNINPEDYFNAVKNVSKFWTDYSYSKLKEPVNKTDWTTHCEPAMINAFYHPLENSIQFPAGILQHIFFSHDRPQYLNYGGIGFIVAHEITHGFDDEGRQFDKNGNLVDWWSPNTKQLFEEKAKCFIEQSSNFTPKGATIKLRGVNLQGEVIADNGGVRTSYYAYQEFLKNHGDEPKLPNLQEYTNRQMFWIASANVWCAKYRPEILKVDIETGYHPPCEYRVTGTFANQEDFARDFSCPVGSRMNPASKCKAW